MGGFDADGKKPGRATLTGAASRVEPDPGKCSRTAPALPRTVSEADGRVRAHIGLSATPNYSDMLAAVLAAKALAERSKPGDSEAREQILALLEPVERRLAELNDHRGNLARFGAGNVAGQAALDMAEAAIRSWRQLVLLGSMVRTEELVTRFRVGEETIQFLTGEQQDSPTLREFNRASKLVGIGAATPMLAPPLAALVISEAPLLAFVAQISARRVALWAATQPAAALAMSELLLGFGLQVGEQGWEALWRQVQDPEQRWYLLAQVLMDYMHVRGSRANLTGARRYIAEPGAELDFEGARDRLGRVRSVLQRVHDEAAAGAEPTSARLAQHPSDDAGYAGPLRGPGAAQVHDEAFADNRKFESSAKHTGRAREVGGRTVAKEPSNGQAALDFSFQVSPSSPRRIGIDVDNNEFVVFDRTGNKVLNKKVSGGIFHGHVRTWDELERPMKKALEVRGLVKNGKISVDPDRWMLQ